MIRIENDKVQFDGDNETLIKETCEIVSAIYEYIDFDGQFMLTAKVFGELRKKSEEKYIEVMEMYKDADKAGTRC